VANRIIVMDKGKCILDGTPEKIFREIELLESVGLAVPQVTYLIRDLRNKGFNISEDIFTIEKAKQELLRIFKVD
ncbi:MAG: energy-coupling factor transport system ATP-binding protein, partial [Clostridium sp.]